MSRGIIIFGSAGAGKTTLGKIVADKLNFPYYDIDNYIWRNDTERPFTVMYTHDEKINRLMTDISKYEHFVMAGSMDSFNEPFVSLFDLAVHITASVETRIARVHKRELDKYGDRIVLGGDMYKDHCSFIENIARYDINGSPCMRIHSQWADSLPCKVLRLSGDEDLNKNMEIIVNEYIRGTY